MKPCDSNYVKVEEARSKISLHLRTVHRTFMKNGQGTMVICRMLAELLHLKIPKNCLHQDFY